MTGPQCYRVLYLFLSPVRAWRLLQRQRTFLYFSVAAFSFRRGVTRRSSLWSATWTPCAKGKRDRPTHVLASFCLPVLSRSRARCHCPNTLPPLLPLRRPVVHFQDHCFISVCHDALFLSERSHHSRHSHATTISTYIRLAAIPFSFWVSCLLVLQYPVCIRWCVVGSTCSAIVLFLVVIFLMPFLVWPVGVTSTQTQVHPHLGWTSIVVR